MINEFHSELVARLATSNIKTEDFTYLTAVLMDSRTCESCKYWRFIDGSQYGTYPPHNMCDKLSNETDKDFGCNKWRAND